MSEKCELGGKIVETTLTNNSHFAAKISLLQPSDTVVKQAQYLELEKEVLVMKFEHPIRQIDLYPYPSRGGLRHHGDLMTIHCQVGSDAELVYREWRNLMWDLGKEEGIPLCILPPDKEQLEIDCSYSLPQRSETGITINLAGQMAEAEAGIGRAQARIRQLCAEQGWTLVDLAEMQGRVDAAFEVLKSKGLKRDSSEVVETSKGEYGFWVNSGISTVPARKISAEMAMKRALEKGPTCTWKVADIEEFAESPESSRLFGLAMTDMGFRLHKTVPGRWVRSERR